MLKALFAVRLEALKSWLTGSTRVKKAQSKGKLIGFAALMLYALAALGLMFWHIFDTIGGAFHMVGFDWLYFTMLAIMCFAIMFIGSIFTAKAQLYEARDNDLLLSMPIKPLEILLSRMFMLWVIAFVLDLLAAVPALMVWSRVTEMTARHTVCFVLLILIALPLLVLAVGALFGWLLSLATAKMKRKALATTVFSLLFLGAYFYFYSRFNIYLSNMVENPMQYAEGLSSVPFLYRLGAAMADGDLVTTLLFTLASLVIFVLVCAVLTVTFSRTATTKGSGAKTVYVEKKANVHSPQAAVLRRELAWFFKSPAYFLNAGLGAVLAPVGMVLLLVNKRAITNVFAQLPPELTEILLCFVPLMLCMLCSMILLTAPSISLEGRTLWISRSIPVSTADILRAKLRAQNVIGVPSILLLSIAAALVFGGGVQAVVLMLLSPILFEIFVGLLGLMENLRHPNFNWVNETQAVKSSVAALVAIFGSWGVLFIPVFVGLAWGDKLNVTMIVWIFTAVIAVLDLLMYRWIFTKGVRKYEEL